MELILTNLAGNTGGGIEVADKAFSAPFNEGLVHQVVTAYMSTGRAGTKAQKNRGDTAGGGAKPWRQKGTGRARAGTSSSPIWRGGGVTFAAKPRSYAQKVNRKMYRGAMRCIVSELLRRDRMIVAETFTVDAPKTKKLAAKLKELGAKELLIVTEEIDANLELAARNIPGIGVLTSAQADPVSLVAFDKILITVGALRKLEGRLQ